VIATTIVTTNVSSVTNLNRCVDATGIADMKGVELVVVSVLTAALLAVLLEVWP